MRQRHRQERDGRIRDCIKAVLAHDEGYSHADIAWMWLLDDETIHCTIFLYELPNLL